MEENTIYDTEALIELVAKKKAKELKAYTTIFNIIEYPPALLLKGLVVLYPLRKDFERALKIQIRLRKKGTPIPAIDVLIASIALNRGLKVLSRDKHFELIKHVEPELTLVT